jgi:phosphoglycolate phosphatase
MARIGGVVFDKDGTLFDFQASWGPWTRRMIAAEARGDAALAARLAAVLGFDPARDRFHRDSPVVAASVEEVADLILAVAPQDRAGLIARMNALAEDLPQVEAAPLVPLLSGLRGSGLVLGVATNDAERPARLHLRAAGVESLFALVAGSDSGWGAKPGPGQLLAFAAVAGLDPAQCLMVGDSRRDLDAASAAGMRGVAVLTGVADAAELGPGAAAVLASIAELPGWIAAQR